MSTESDMVVVVDPDQGQRLDICKVIRGQGYDVQSFESAEFLMRDVEKFAKNAALCVVSEFDLPGVDGLQLQKELKESPYIVSVIFFVARATVSNVVAAIKNGAEWVLDKSDGVDAIVRHVRPALKNARSVHQAAMAQRAALEQLNSLSVGEHQVLQGILNGQLNKEIAQQLKLSVRTIEQRRRQVFRKLNVQHPASLAQRVLQASQSVPVAMPEDISALSHKPSARLIPYARRADVCRAD